MGSIVTNMPKLSKGIKFLFVCLFVFLVGCAGDVLSSCSKGSLGSCSLPSSTLWKQQSQEASKWQLGLSLIEFRRLALEDSNTKIAEAIAEKETRTHQVRLCGFLPTYQRKEI